MYFYQYDAWNRLVQVNEKGSLAATSFTAAGTIGSGVSPSAVGPMKHHHAYDGLGRLVKTSSPLDGIFTENGSTAQQTERFYYDGIRRIQEVVVNPVTNMFDEEFAARTGLSGMQNEILADQGSIGGGEVDGTVAAMSYEQAQLSLGQSLAQNGGTNNLNISTPLPSGTTLAREYIWGPGDRGTDEMLAQFDTTGKAWYPIQDGGGDIVALVETIPGGGGAGRVAAQFVYDAYGAVLSAEHFYAHPYLHAGHKGLFIERLDQPNVDTSTMTEIPRLVPLATNYVHMRSRSYAPGLGRFFQRDMNQTGSALNSIEAYHGAGAFPAVAAMDMQGL